MTRSLTQLVLIQLKGFFREPAILFWAILFPILMAWILGVAFSSKGESARTVYVIGNDIPPQFRETRVVGTDVGSPVRIRFVHSSEKEAVRAIKRGLTSLYIEVQGDSVTYHYDPKNADGQLTHLMLERNPGDVSLLQPLEAKGTRYIDFLIPGLISLGIMNSCLWGIGWSLIETRMKKLLRRMVATPMKRSEFLGSFVIARIILNSVEILLLLLFSWLYFGTEITGSPLALILLFLAGIFSFCGIGILIASRTQKTEVGNGLINAVTLSMTILSGIFFNYHNFPDWAVTIISFLPLTLLADAVRAVFIEAAQLTDVVGTLIILVALGLVTFIIGLRIFKWY